MSQTQVDLIVDGSIVTSDLSDNVITTAKITDKSVTKAKLADDVVFNYPFTTRGFNIPL